MTQVSVRASLEEEAAQLLSSEEENETEISSVKSLPITSTQTRGTSGRNVKQKEDTASFKKPSGKGSKPANKPATSSSRATTKLNDLSKLEEKLSGQIQDVFRR